MAEGRTKQEEQEKGKEVRERGQEGRQRGERDVLKSVMRCRGNK